MISKVKSFRRRWFSWSEHIPYFSFVYPHPAHIPVTSLCWPCKCTSGGPYPLLSIAHAQNQHAQCTPQYVWRHNSLFLCPLSVRATLYPPPNIRWSRKHGSSFGEKNQLIIIMARYFPPNGCFDGYVSHTCPLSSSVSEISVHFSAFTV